MTFLNLPIEVYVFTGVMALFAGIFIFIYMVERNKRKKYERIIAHQKALSMGVVEKSSHPYICSKCKFDMIGSVSAESFNCPECGAHHDWKRVDALIAQGLIKHNRVDSNYLTFHVYVKTKEGFFKYARTILSSTAEVATQAARELEGETAIAVAGNRNKEGEVRFIPDMLAVVQSHTAMASLDEVDKIIISRLE